MRQKIDEGRFSAACDEYAAIVREHSPEWECMPAQWAEAKREHRVIAFACESALMSGADSSQVPWKVTYSKDEEDEHPWIRVFMEHDVAVTAACMYPSTTERIVPPIAVNMPLCRHRVSAEWRVGDDLSLDPGIPPGAISRRLADIWTRSAMLGARRHVNASEEARRVFAWQMHDAFLYIRPFRDGNSRTARALVQSVRYLVGLPPVFISRTHRASHRTRAQFFKANIFEPLMQRHGYR